MIRGAIFDLDGTLLDSMSIWDTIGEDYLRSLGIEPRENLRETFKTFTLRQAADYCRSEYQVALSSDEIITSINGMVEEFYVNTAPLKPGAAGLLSEMRDRNIRMCVATVTDSYLAEKALERCGVRRFFSGIFSCAQTGESKETPAIYRRAMAHLGTAREDTVVFEDTVHALKAAKTDGFLTAAVYDEHEENQEELKRLAHIYIEDFSDAEGILDRLSKEQPSDFIK